MNDILTDEAKSFRLLRPKTKAGTQKPLITYTTKLANTLFISIGKTSDDIFTGLTNLFGPNGTKKSFMRYYYPKRFIWQSALYPQPRVMDFIDAKAKDKMVYSKIPGFRGQPKNKIIDTRNCILDFTDIMKLIIPVDKNVMIKSNVVNYVHNIYPELLCYLLFDNPKHDKKNDIEENSTESLENKSSSEETLSNRIKHFFNQYELPKEFHDMSDEEWNALVSEIAQSVEAFTEKFTAKTQIFSMTGPGIGFDKYGFDKFIISIPYTLKASKFVSRQFIQEKIPLTRQLKVNSDVIYQLTFLQFLYRAYTAYFNGSSSEEFINEMNKHNITFHIYAENGTGFCMNFKELKNGMKYRPEKFLQYYTNRLQLLTMCNTGMVTDTDLDDVDREEVVDEYNSYHKAKNDVLEKELKKDLKPVVENDAVLQTVIATKDESKIEVVSAKDAANETTVKKHIFSFMPTSKSVFESQQAMKTLQKLDAKFAAKGTKIVSDNEEELPDVVLTDKDFTDILESNTEDESDEEPIDNLNKQEETNIIDDVYEEKDSINFDDDENDENRTDNIDSFLDDYGSFDDNVVDTDIADDGDYVEIKPTKNGPIKITDAVKKEEIKRSPADIKRIEMLKEKYKSIEINGKTIEDIIGNSNNIEVENFAVKSVANAPKGKNKGLTGMNVVDFQRSYIKNNYQADIINAVRSLSINKADPLYMTNVKVEDSSNQFTDSLTYTFTLEDEFKKKHELSFDVPKIDEYGMMKIGGNKQYINKQLIRLPICKMGPDKVYITTEQNSYQVQRTGILLNRSSEIIRHLLSDYLYNKENVIIERGDASKDNSEFITTLEYDVLAKNYFFIRFNSPDSKFGEYVEIYFSQKYLREKLKKHPEINTGFKDNIIPNNVLPIGINYTTNTLYYIDLSTKSSVNGSILGIIMSVLNENEEIVEFIKTVKTPKRRICTKCEIQDRVVPMVAFLNYLFGWEKVKSYFPESEIEFSEKPIKNTNKLFIKFYDGYMYYNQYPLEGALLLNGFAEMDTASYKYEDLNNPGFYINYTYDKFHSRNIVKGWITCKENMLDLKTLQILKELNLPTDFLEIFLYCNELLTDNQVKPDSDISNYRIRSNEIVSECVYKVVNDYYTSYKKRTNKNLKLSIPRNAVLAKVYKTNIVQNYNDVNPIGEIRSMGLTTFKGPGGTKLEQAFTIPKRAYNESYYGVFAMSTPDNSNAGITKELTINTKVINTLGMIGNVDDNASINDVASIAEAIVPYANKVDDPSRIAFCSTQNAHVGGIPNSSLPIVRSGIEKIVKHMTSSTFVINAEEDGVVENIDEVAKKIYIKYKSGKKVAVSYADKYLKNSDVFTTAVFNKYVKEGQKIKAGDTIAADERFFKYDPISKELNYTQAINGLVAIMENSYTEDDSNVLSASFAKQMSTDLTHRRQISIGARDTLMKYCKVGDKVDLSTPLIVFDDSGVYDADDGTFDMEDDLFKDMASVFSEGQLDLMIHQTPKAKHNGYITDMKVYWTVPLEKMSPSIREFVKEYIDRYKKTIKTDKEYTGTVPEDANLIEVSKLPIYEQRIHGTEVNPNGGIVIEYFISEENIMGAGDKISLNSSLKTVNADIIEKDLEPFTETGFRIDGIFSWISQNARMVNSIWYNGFIGKILYTFSKRTAYNFLKEIGYENIPELERRKLPKTK